MTLLFQKSNFCGNFITFLEVSKLLVTNYFLTVTVLTDKVQITKKCLQLKQRAVYQFATYLQWRRRSSTIEE